MAFCLCREQLAQLSVHADIASKLNRLIDEKSLVEMGKLEQDLVYGNATSKEVVTFLGYHQQLPTHEKVSLWASIRTLFMRIEIGAARHSL